MQKGQHVYSSKDKKFGTVYAELPNGKIRVNLQYNNVENLRESKRQCQYVDREERELTLV